MVWSCLWELPLEGCRLVGNCNLNSDKVSGLTSFFYPTEVWRSLEALACAKAVWSADYRAYILVQLLDGPIYKLLKRLIHIIQLGLEHCGSIICADSQ
jgi:hypothetical protein